MVFLLVKIVAVAIDAFVGGVLVHNNLFVSDLASLGMALGTRDVCVTSSKSKVGFGVVVKRGRNPTSGVVAISAVCLIVLGLKLLVVGIFMASFALGGSALKARFRISGRFVAIRASNGAMSAEQRIFCF